MTTGQVPETIMTGNTADISHIAEFVWHDWVMFRNNELSFTDNKFVLGRYLGPAIGTVLAVAAKIQKKSEQSVCLQINPTTPHW
jgi:hypothetical protein